MLVSPDLAGRYSLALSQVIVAVADEKKKKLKLGVLTTCLNPDRNNSTLKTCAQSIPGWTHLK